MNKVTNSPIGIFDSGLGGLTVLQSLESNLPNESFIYFGDTARVPYGNKSADTIIHFSKQIVKFLQNHGVKMIVVACNTSSALALTTLKINFNLPILGVIEPSVNLAESSNSSDSVVVLGTRVTIDSHAYSKMFTEIHSAKNIIEKSCPLFVPIIEEGLLTGEISEDIIRYYLSDIKDKNFNQIILGCTHYPILKDGIQNYLGKNVNLITSGEALSPVIKQFLIDNNLSSTSRFQDTKFFISDFPQRFNELGSRFLGRELKNILHISNF